MAETGVLDDCKGSSLVLQATSLVTPALFFWDTVVYHGGCILFSLAQAHCLLFVKERRMLGDVWDNFTVSRCYKYME